MIDLSVYKIDVDTPVGNGKFGVDPRTMSLRINGLVEWLETNLPENLANAFVKSIVAGTDISIDSSDPTAPIISFSGSSGSGGTGEDGADGWSPILRIVSDNDRQVLELFDWVGGTGTKPTTLGYLGSTGIVSNIVDASNIKGDSGTGGSTGITVSGSVDTNHVLLFTDNSGETVKSGGLLGSMAFENVSSFLVPSDLNSINTEITTINTTISDLSGDVSDLELQYSSLSTNLTSFQTTTNNSISGINTSLTMKASISGNTGALIIPKGTTAQRPESPDVGWLRKNTETGFLEEYNGSEWEPVKTENAVSSLGSLNDIIITEDYTIPVGKNLVSAGPIEIADGVTVTVSVGSTWSIV